MLVCFATIPASVVAAAADAGCRIISRYGIGYDNIDVDAATERKLLVTYVPDYCLDDVADHAMALLLALARGVFHAGLSVREGGWSVPHGSVHRLQGRRLAVIGVGGIGARVVDRARGFGIEPVGFDPYRGGLARARRTSVQLRRGGRRSRLRLPARAAHPRYTAPVNAESIAGMRRAPIVVNTARGPLVDMDAAVEALDSGALSGLALDVTETEPPPPDHPLRSHPRAVLTPHMAFYSVEAQAELQRRAAEEVARALTGEPPDRPVNPEVHAARS